MMEFSTIFFIYIPIITLLFLKALHTMARIQIKYDKKYVVIQIKGTRIDELKAFISGNIMLIVMSIIPLFNILLVVSNVLGMDTYVEKIIDRRIEYGSLKLKEEEDE